jgi:hypothetical protein
LLGAAVLLPVSLHWPRWVEAEVVLGAWWLIVGTTLVVLLFRGFRLKDDWVYFAPWETPPGSTRAAKAGGGGSGCSSTGLEGCTPDGCDGCSGIGDAGEAIVVVIAAAVALAVTFGAVWLFVEFAMPIVFLLMYTLIHRAISRVANDRNGCEGNLLKSIGYGALWATVYLTPLALVTFALHRLVPGLR